MKYNIVAKLALAAHRLVLYRHHMPELPEVETVVRGLEAAIKGKRIKALETSGANMRQPWPKDVQRVKGQTVERLLRRAKYILMHLSGGDVMVVHLGMSGRMTINPAAKQKHDHMILTFQDGTTVAFNDPRRFGLVALSTEKDLHAHRLFAHLGPEPFDKAFSAPYLAAQLSSKKKTALKVAIMDQALVVGVGNIYASEALFDARISPYLPAAELTEKMAQVLIPSIRKVLDKAIAAGGSSLRDYRQSDGNLGYFQHQFKVYGRAGAACTRKGCGGMIEKTVQAARATFYCPVCQPRATDARTKAAKAKSAKKVKK